MSATAEHAIPASSVRAPLLEVAGLTKTFGGLKALDGVDLEVRPGEVVGLVGDNGAGKSTLVRCIAGVYAPDEGEILVEGQPVQTHKTYSPKQAAEAGI
jgi:ABC-type sugar transport system ATPase subunit